MTLTASPTTSAAVDHAAFADLAATTSDTWFTTTDHRRVGRLMLGAVLGVAVVGSALGGFVSQRIDDVLGGRLGNRPWLGSNQDRAFSFTRMFSAHGMGMVFLVITPLFLALATIAVPRQIGSARLAFPRLQAFVLWGYVIGAGLYIASYAIGDGPPAADIFQATALTGGTRANRATDLVIASLMLLTLVTIAGCVNIVTTVLTHRRHDLAMEDVRPFTWAAFVTAGISLITAPVFLAGLFLLYLDQHFGGGLFNGDAGPRIWVHTIWLFGRPDAFLLLLPALGAATEIVASRATKPLVGGVASKHLLTAFGVLTLAAWTGGSELTSAVILPTARWQTGLIFLPAALLVLLWLGSLAQGVKPDLSLLFVAGFVVVLALCAVNVVVAAIAKITDPNAQLAWQVGQTRVLLIGAPFIALLGAVVEFSPMAYGRRLVQGLSGLAALAVIGGTVLLGLAICGLGYESGFDKSHTALSVIALIGGLLTAAGVALLILNLVASTLGRKGQLADDSVLPEVSA